MKKLKTSSSYIPMIDFWKFIFTIIIILYHANKMEGFEKANLFPYGYIVVEFFFMVSGFFMAKSICAIQSTPIKNLGDETWRFTFKKTNSFYTPFFVAFWIHFVIRMIIEEVEAPDLYLEITHTIRELTLTYSSGITFGRYHNGPTWYISSMIIAMFIIYPFLRKFFKTFSSVFAPTFALLTYAYLQHEYSSINLSAHFGKYLSLGLLRAVCGICVGIFIFHLVNKVKSSNSELTVAGKSVMVILELGLATYIILIAANYDKLFKDKFYGYFAIILQAIFVFILFLNPIKFKNTVFINLCKLAGELSFYYYLNHRIWTRVFETTIPDLGFGKKQVILLYFIHITLTVIFAVIITHLLNRLKPYIFKASRKFFLKSK
ncbi:MAG: acyltransferase [Clostridia bacterium]|nr:acyltransferase [Clostridia bacterium]